MQSILQPKVAHAWPSNLHPGAQSEGHKFDCIAVWDQWIFLLFFRFPLWGLWCDSLSLSSFSYSLNLCTVPHSIDDFINGGRAQQHTNLIVDQSAILKMADRPMIPLHSAPPPSQSERLIHHFWNRLCYSFSKYKPGGDTDAGWKTITCLLH